MNIYYIHRFLLTVFTIYFICCCFFIKETNAQTTVGTLNISVNDLRTASEINIQLFDNTNFSISRVRLIEHNQNAFDWIGEIISDPESRVVISANNGSAVGILRTQQNIYELNIVENGSNTIIEYDPESFNSEIEPGAIIFQDSFESEPMLDNPLLKGAVTALPPIIDVMVLFTQEANNDVDDMEIIIRNAVALANDSYDVSGIDLQINLVHFEQVNYEEADNIETDLSRLRDKNDNFIDDIHDLRNQFSADLVSLFVSEGQDYCGVAYVMETVSLNFESSAFSVVDWSCAGRNLSFAHELGHNMGARHDRFVDDTDGKPFDFSHGFVNVDEGWRTIMAYDDACEAEDTDCPRQGFWSNPDRNYNGSPTGIEINQPDAADNRSTLNMTVSTVAGFRTNIQAAEGKVTFLRVHDVGTGWGAPPNFLDAEVIVKLDTQQGKAFGFQLRNDSNGAAHGGMLDVLRDAFKNDKTVRIEYINTGFSNSLAIRIIKIS